VSEQHLLQGDRSLACLLENAERRQEASPELRTFDQCLLLETIEFCNLRSISLWLIHGENGTLVESVTSTEFGRDGSVGMADRLNRSSKSIQTETSIPSAVAKARVGVVSSSVSTASPDKKGVEVPLRVVAAEVSAGVRVVACFAGPLNPSDDSLLLAVTDVFADLQRRALVTRLLDDANAQQRMHRVISLLHSDLDERRVINTFASDVPELAGCRRITVAQRRSARSWMIQATTGVADPSRRSDDSERIGELIRRAERSSGVGSAVSGSEADAADPDSSADAHFWKNSIVLPASLGREWKSAVQAVVLEPVNSRFTSAESSRIELLTEHFRVALDNCRRSTKSRRGWGGKIMSVTATYWRIIAGVVALIAAYQLMYRQAELKIHVPGVLVPARREHIYAPEYGVVTDLAVGDGTVLKPDKLFLCRLKNDDLEIQLQEAEGQLSAVHARMAALESGRGSRGSESALIAAEQAELKEKVDSLGRQIEIFERRKASLTLSAPFSGQVYGEHLAETLTGRPVLRGQYLFEIADPTGPWELQLRIPEADAGHVIQTFTGSGKKPIVRFSLETSAETELEAELSSLADHTEVDAAGVLTILATARLDSLTEDQKRAGAGVIARIHCGQSSAGYVWFRKLIEFYHRKLRF
jgi:hypothetical protein